MLKEMNLRTRLILGFGMITVLLLILTGIGIRGMYHMDEDMERISKVNVTRLEHINDLARAVQNIGINIRNIIVNDNLDKKAEYKERIIKFREEYAQSLKKVEELANKRDPKGLELISKIKEAIATSKELNNKVIDLGMANKDAEAAQLLSKVAAPAERAMLKAIEDTLHYNLERNNMRYHCCPIVFKAAPAEGLAMLSAG